MDSCKDFSKVWILSQFKYSACPLLLKSSWILTSLHYREWILIKNSPVINSNHTPFRESGGGAGLGGFQLTWQQKSKYLRFIAIIKEYYKKYKWMSPSD